MTARVLKPAITAALAIALASTLAFAPAEAASSREKRDCTDDVHRLCPREKKDSESLRYCMEAHQNQLSRRCVRALEDAGEIPRGALKGR